MTLASGTRLGVYEIVGPLGAGGMGEVYRARDAQLDRTVAIKALPESFAPDPDRLARFEREAKLLAALSHPNIAGIHGLVESGGRRYLALEFVDGESLLERLRRGALPVDEALEVCAQVAAALAAAHDAGIVHRDLKPGNVMLRADGVVKVLDFGLARGPAPGGSGADVTQSPTLTSPATLPGVILGTAAYMSPEQAKGRAVDRRADVWAWGCVLYECLSGRRAFAGEDVSDTLAAVLRGEPDWSAIPARTPAGVVTLLRRCLRKDPRERHRDLGDARLALADAAAPGGAPADGAPSALARALPWLAALVLALVAALVWVRRPPPEPALAVVLPIPGSGAGAFPGQFALAPDGRSVVCATADSTGAWQVWVRRLDRLQATHVADGDMPFWSPDSRNVGFFADGKLRRVPAEGGSVLDVCDAPDPRGGTWSPRGEIVFAPTGQGPLARVSAEGGTPRPATRLDAAHGDRGHRYPQFLPDGRHFIYLAMNALGTRLPTYVASLDDPVGRPLAEGDVASTFAPPDWLLSMHGSGLAAQRVDLRRGRAVGEPVDLRVTPQIQGPWALAPVASATAGRLVYTQPDTRPPRAEWWDWTGHESPGPALPPGGDYGAPVLSPDGGALCLVLPGANAGSLWRVDLATDAITRIGRANAATSGGRWTNDGAKIAFPQLTATGQTLVVKDQGGRGAERVVYRTSRIFTVVNDWAPDGRHLLFSQRGSTSRNDLEILDTETGQVTPYLETPAEEGAGAISPDGNWVAYLTDESGTGQVVVNSFPHAGLARPVSTAGATDYLTGAVWWVNGGADLLFLNPSLDIMRAHVRSLAPPAFDPPVRLFRTPYGWNGMWPGPGGRLLMIVPSGDAAPPGQVLVTHWADGLGR